METTLLPQRRNMLLLIWSLVLMCSSALATERLSPLELPDRDAPENIPQFLERRYPTGKAKFTAEDVGEPLLLTPMIEAGDLEKARKAAYVNPDYLLPGMESYAGYFTVNKEYNANLFFWYFPVKNQPVEKTPWIIWLQGGPGASSLYGLFTEIGPLVVTANSSVEEIKYSWGKNHSLLFIDNPVGTGYSFTDDDRGYATNQTTIGENLYNALQQFLTLFHELRKAPLTIAGESYAGKHIPSLGVQILWNRDKDQPINLHGLAIGNGFMDPETLLRYSYFVREVGLVDDNAADQMKSLETAIVQFIKRGEMSKAFDYYNRLLNVFSKESNLSVYNFMNEDSSLEDLYEYYIQSGTVRKALHVGSTNFSPLSHPVYIKLKLDFMHSVKPWVEELLENYRVMCYNGHLDVIVAYHPSVNTYNAFNFSGTEEFKKAKRHIWYHDKKLAGYYRTAENFTEVMVHGAGHMVPTDQPAAALGLISAFARGITLAEDTGILMHVDKHTTYRYPEMTLATLIRN